MKFFYRYIFLVLVTCVATRVHGSGDSPFLLGTIVGSSPVTVGSTVTYEYESGTTIFDPYWNAGSLGVVQSQWTSAAKYYVSITWTTTGTSTLRFYEDGGMTQLATKSISITALPAPSTTITTAMNCGNTVVTRATSPPTGAAYDWWWQTSSTGTSTTLGSGTTATLTSASSLYLRARTRVSPYSWSTSQSLGSISVNAAPPAAPASATHGYIISNNATAMTLSVAAASGATSYAWYEQASGGTAVAGVTGTTYSPVLSQTKTYYVASKRDGCESTTRKAVTAYIYAEPVIAATNHGNVVLNSPVTLSVSNAIYDTYQWLDGSNNTISGATGSSYVTNVAGNYRVRVTKGATPAFTTTIFTVGTGVSGQVANYVTARTILKGGVYSNEASLPIKHVNEVIQYFDGLGRPLQTVNTQGSPAGRDIVQPVEYDAFGREIKKYLPYIPQENNGWYKTSAPGSVVSFYSSASGVIANDTQPYSETEFEASPLDRPEKAYGPGAAWKSNARAAQYDYLTNVHGSSGSQEKIIAWAINSSSGMPVRRTALINYVETGGYYSTAQLMVNVTLDEEGNAVREYTNKAGQVILKKVQADSAASVSNYLQWAYTYYIYDDAGNLRYVLQPELSKKIHGQADTYVVTTTDLDNYAFQYKYDKRKRMAEKRVPGAGWVYMVYDDRDRLVLTQDANQRSGSTKYWSFTKYDILNRPVLTGIKDTAQDLTQAGMQNVVDTYYAAAATKPWRKYYESYVGTSVTNVHGYSNASYPVVTTGATLNVNQYLTVTYYDRYDFRSSYVGNYSYVTDTLSVTVHGVTYTQPVSEHTRVIGQITGAKVKVLDGGITGGYTWLKTVNYYDQDYRIIQSISDNYKGGEDRTSTLYDFTGKVLATKTTHTERDFVWQDVVGATVTGNIIKRTGTSTAGAASVQQLAAGQDGWLEFTVSELNTTRVVGLNNSNPDVAGGNIDYGFNILSTGTVNVFENNSPKYTLTGVKAGDVLRVERTGTVVKYYHNGVLQYPSATGSTTALLADISLTSNNATLVGVRTSFTTSMKRIYRRFDYDDAGRLVNTWHRVDGNGEILLAHNVYNELGQLIDKKLHSSISTAADAKQSVDYRYNIRGWLTSINGTDLAASYADASNASEAYDLFGMDLGYNETLSTGNVGLYNGNIRAITWSSLGESTEQKGYTYRYDPMSRIKDATYKTKTTSWQTATNQAFRETGYTYDLNGNLLTLKRHDTRGTTGVMDNLTYTYSGSNRLLKVADTADDFAGFVDGTNTGNDYTYDGNGNMTTDQNKGITTAMTYNFLNLPELVSKGGNTVRYIYDASGRKLSQVATFGTTVKHTDYAGELVYERDALQFINHEEGRVVTGATKLVYTNPGETTTEMTAVGTTLAAVTDNGSEKYIRATATSATAGTGIFPIGSNYSVSAGERYMIRAKAYRDKGTATASSAAYLLVKVNGSAINSPGALLPEKGVTAVTEYWVEQVVTIPAGGSLLEAGVAWNTVNANETISLNEFEIVRLGNSGAEYQYHLIDHLGNVRVTFTTLDEVDNAIATLETANMAEEQGDYLYYNEAVKVNFALFDHTNQGGTYYSTRLNGTANERTGLAKSISVMPGDTIRAKVYAKYLGTNSNNWTTAVRDLITSIANNAAAPTTFIDGGAVGSTGGVTAPFTSVLNKSSETGSAPKAFLNYLIFDRNYQFLDGGYVRLSNNCMENGHGAPHDSLNVELIIEKPGYVYLYLSNDNVTLGGSQVEVYFDDFKVEHTKSPVVQMEDYYPFGLKFNLYARESSLENTFKLFQGQQHITDLNLNWDSFKWRNYQADIGRFFNIDPLADKYVHNSTYAFAENKVITFRELEGLEGVHYMDGNKHVIEKNVVVLLEKHKVAGEGASEKELKKVEKQNERIDVRNKEKIENVTTELNSFFNGSDGKGARNSKGESVTFKFNVSGAPDIDQKGKTESQRNAAYRKIGVSNGIQACLETSFTVNNDLIAPAAVLTTESVGGVEGETIGAVIMRVNFGTPDGTTAHETLHSLGLPDNGYTKGGLLNSPPQTINSSEVDDVLKMSYEKKF